MMLCPVCADKMVETKHTYYCMMCGKEVVKKDVEAS